MGYSDEAPSGETDDQVAERITAFALKLNDLVKAEPYDSGLGGALCGYGLGLMLAQGAGEAEIREVFEKTLSGLMAGAAAIRAHEEKTFS